MKHSLPLAQLLIVGNIVPDVKIKTIILKQVGQGPNHFCNMKENYDKVILKLH